MRQQPNNYEYEVSDALPMSSLDGIKDEVTEGVARFEKKLANKKPTWKWVKDKPNKKKKK